MKSVLLTIFFALFATTVFAGDPPVAGAEARTVGGGPRDR